MNVLDYLTRRFENTISVLNELERDDLYRADVEAASVRATDALASEIERMAQARKERNENGDSNFRA